MRALNIYMIVSAENLKKENLMRIELKCEATVAMHCSSHGSNVLIGGDSHMTSGPVKIGGKYKM